MDFIANIEYIFFGENMFYYLGPGYYITLTHTTQYANAEYRTRM